MPASNGGVIIGNISWTKSWSSSDDGSPFGGADIQNIQNDITGVVNGSVDTTNFASTLTFADGDYIDLSAILHDDTSLQGLRLPQVGASPSSPTSGEGQIGWDQTNNTLKTYDGSAWRRVVRVDVGSTTRDMTTASGTQAITGVGFTPVAVVFLAIENSADEMSVGVDDGTNKSVISTADGVSADTWIHSDSFSIQLSESSGVSYAGVVSAFSTDGFTITWTRTGTPSGTLQLKYLCIG